MITNLATGLQRFSLEDLTEEPWRNGGGVTRTLMRRDNGDKPLWRISVADITGNAPFSRFEGLDRHSVLVEGYNVTLCGDWGAWSLSSVGDIARYPGELSVRTELGCALARFFNVMADRTQMRVDLRVSSSPREDIVVAGDGALMVMDGDVDVVMDGNVSTRLSKNDGLLFDGFRDSLHLHFKDGPCHWLLTTLNSR